MAETVDNPIVSLAAFGIAGLIAWQFLRNRSVRQGQIYFAPSAPPSFAVDNSVDLLNPMQVSANGIAFIKALEGLKLTPFNDAGHTAIGYGHDFAAGASIPQRITIAQANSILSEDIATVEQTLNTDVKVPLSQNQFDALASFVFNIGDAAFAQSTLLRMLNNGNYAGASAQLMRWIHSEGRTDPGLRKRRQAEQALFNS